MCRLPAQQLAFYGQVLLRRGPGNVCRCNSPCAHRPNMLLCDRRSRLCGSRHCCIQALHVLSQLPGRRQLPVSQPLICRVQGLASERSSTELDKLRQQGAGPAAEAGRLGEKQTPTALRSNVLG